jgi:hypothetical protein
MALAAATSDVIIATTTWDAGDIIEEFLRYYELLGARRVLVLDLNSTDGTRDILGAARWKDFVEVIDLSAPLKEVDMSGELLNLAHGSEWCLFCDPDEFLVTPNMVITDPVLEASDRDTAVITLPRRNMTGRRSATDDTAAQLSPSRCLDLRIDRPHERRPEEYTARDLTPPWIFTALPPKVLVRPDRIRSLNYGDHSAETEPGADQLQSAVCLLHHYPFRSYRHFERKVSQAVEHGAADWPPPNGWQYRRWILCRDRGALLDEYREQFVDDRDVAGLLASRALVRDTRVSDLLRSGTAPRGKYRGRVANDPRDAGADIAVVGPRRVGTAVGAVVLGMSRSGTSAVTRALVSSGFYAGVDRDLLLAHPDNPAGYWERLSLVLANEKILERIGGTWFMPPTSEAQIAAQPWAMPELRDLLGQLRAEAAGAPVAVKDPRIGVLLKLWGPVIDGLLHPVLATRDPVEVAFSLAARDGTPTAFALAGWELHTALLLKHLNGRVVTVAPYEQLVGSPEAVVRLVADVTAHLTAECARRVDPGAAPEAVQSQLHRNHADSSAGLDHLTGRQADMWDFVRGLPAGNHVLDVPAELTLPSRRGAAELTLCETERVRQSRYVEELQARAAGAEDRAMLAEQRATHAEKGRDEALYHYGLVDGAMEAMRNSTSWRLTRPLRAVTRAIRGA